MIFNFKITSIYFFTIYNKKVSARKSFEYDTKHISQLIKKKLSEINNC